MVASSPASGNYDHPSYLTRQTIDLVSTAGANSTSGGRAFLSDMRLRKVAVNVRTAGTTTGAGNSMNLMVIGTYLTGYGTTTPFTLTTNTGTNTITTLVLGTNLANTVSTSTDMNLTLLAGAVLAIKNGADATGVAAVTVEAYVNPGSTWTGPNN